MDNQPLPDQADLFTQSVESLPITIAQGEARFIVSTTENLTTVTIQAADALVRSVSKTFLNDEMPEPRTAIRIDFTEKTISIFPQITYFSEYLYRKSITALQRSR